jgi:hypothetical protein
MNPARFSQMMRYLTRAKKANPNLPDVFPASKAPIPAKTQNVKEMEAVNQFMLRNPRVEKNNGGSLKFYPIASGGQTKQSIGPGVNLKTRDINYGGTLGYEGDNIYGGVEYNTGKVKFDVTDTEGNTLFKDTLSKDDAVNFIVGLGDRKGDKFQIKTDKDFTNMQVTFRKSFADGGMLVKPSADGSRPGYAKAKKGFAAIKDKYGLEEMIRMRDKGKDIPKVREYLDKVLRKKDKVVFKNIKDIMKKAGLPETSKVDTDVSRLLTGEYDGRVQTEGQLQKKQYGNNAEKFRKILRNIKQTIPKDKKQFINVSYTIKKNNLPGKTDSGSYYRILNEPEFKNTFVVLSRDVQSNPQIIRFAEEFEKLYEISDVDRDFFRQLAINIYGDDNPKSIKMIGADASKYAEFLYGVRDVTDADGNKLKLPSVEKRGDYLFEIIDETLGLQEGEKGKVKSFKFDPGIVRDRMFAIRDGLLGFKEGQTESQRTNIKKLLKKGYNLDEVAGLAATHELAPGYTELVQGLKKKVNADKMVKIDKPFSRIFEQIITDEKPTKGYKYNDKFYQDINEVVKLYNKDAAAYGKKYNIDVPLIEYDRGKKIKPENFLPNFKYLSPAAQANVKDLASKGIGVRTKAFTMGQLENIDLTSNKKTQANILKKMGFKCKFAGSNGGLGSCDDPDSYTDDINKTRQDLNSDDVRVRAAAKAKLNNGLQIAKTLPKIGTFLRRAGQATLGGIAKALEATGLATPVGLAIEGIVEGGIYDYFRGKGYTHDQAYQETFFPGIISGRPEGVPWYGGAESLLEKELTEVREKPTVLEDGTIVPGKIIEGAISDPKILQYQQALKDQDQVFDAFARKEKFTQLQGTDQGTYKKLASDASADIQDLNRSGTISNINRIMNPESMASQAYQTAVERQAGAQDQRARDYKAENFVQQEPSDFAEQQLQKERNKAMLEMFPPPTVDTVRDAYTAAGYGDSLKFFSAQDYKDKIKDFDDYQKQSYFADNFRLEKAGGGIAKLAGVDSGPPPESGPNSQGLLSLKNRVRNY